jgi:2-iminobutanoate/2-iminopropanoate deaminase
MKKPATALALVVFATVHVAIAQQNNLIQKQKFHWGKEQDTTAGYAQAVKVDNVIYVSGTVSGDIIDQVVTNVYKDLEKTLQYFLS